MVKRLLIAFSFGILSSIVYIGTIALAYRMVYLTNIPDVWLQPQVIMTAFFTSFVGYYSGSKHKL